MILANRTDLYHACLQEEGTGAFGEDVRARVENQMKEVIAMGWDTLTYEDEG